MCINAINRMVKECSNRCTDINKVYVMQYTPCELKHIIDLIGKVIAKSTPRNTIDKRIDLVCKNTSCLIEMSCPKSILEILYPISKTL